jgi:putative transport protein
VPPRSNALPTETTQGWNVEFVKTLLEHQQLMTLFLTVAIGYLVGEINIKGFSLGVGAVLFVALILGKLRRTRGMNWTVPISANLVIRDLGLTLFLAGRHVVRAEVRRDGHPDGFADARLGALVLLALVLPVLLIGMLVYRMPYDELAGIISGACGNPAILAYANRLAPSDKPDIGYAMIFPAMTIVKIIFVDIVAGLW